MAFTLPSDWGTYGATQKINWFNQNQVDVDTLLGQGVDQASIDWMLANGYLGTYAPPAPVPYVAPTYNTLATEQEMEDYYDPYAADETFLQQIVASAPAPTTALEPYVEPAPAPAPVVAAPAPYVAPTPAPAPVTSSTHNTLATEASLEDSYDPYAASEQDLLNIVGGTAPAVAAPATPASAPLPLQNKFYDFMYAAGQDPALATQRGIQYARQQGWSPEQTTQEWNKALGTNFTVEDFYRVTGLTAEDPSFADSNAAFSNFGDTDSWDFGAGAVYDPQTNLIKAPGIVFQSGKDAIVSDELFWNPHSVTGADLQKRIQDTQAQGQRAGVVITPYAVFQGKATDEQLLNEIKNSGTDFVTIDPYYLGFDASSKELYDWAKNFIPQVNALGKEVKLVTQGFAPKGQEQQTLEHNQKMLALPGVSEFINFGLEDAKDLQGDPNWVSIGNDYGQVQPNKTGLALPAAPAVAAPVAQTSTWTGTGGIGGDLSSLPVTAPKNDFQSAVLPFLSQGVQNIAGTIYQPQYEQISSGSGEEGGRYEQGALQNVLRYKEGQTAPGQTYEILDPATGQVTGTGKFKEAGNAWDLIKSAATDLAPLATFALGVGPLSGMLGGAAANALGISGLTAAQTAALGSALGSAGLTAVQGGSLEDTLKAALPGALSGFVNPVISEAVGNILPEQITKIQSIDDALVKGAQSLATAATKAAVTGQDIDVIKTLMPAIAGGISDEFGVDYKTALTGLTVAEKLISGDDLGFKEIIGIAQLLPGTTTTTTKPSSGQTASAGYGGAETGGFFDSEEAQALEDDIQSILARYPEANATPYFPEFEKPLLTAELPAQRVEVAASASAPTIEDFIDRIAQEEAVYALLETLQQIPVTGEKEATLQDLFNLPEQPIPQEVLADVESILERYPAGQTVTTTGQKEAAPTLQDFIDQITQEETFYALPEPEQRYEVVAQTPQPPPISELERILFEDANIMPEPEQRYEVTAPIPAPYFPEFEEPLLTTEPPTQQVEVKQALPVTEAPVLDVPVEIVEPPALPPEQVVEITGTKPEAPIIPLDDIPEIVFPEVVEPPLPPLPPDQVIDVTGTKRPEINVPALENVPEVIAPPVVAPTIPTTPATTPSTTPATTPATTPKQPARPTYDPLLLLLLGMASTPQEREQILQDYRAKTPDSPFGTVFDTYDTTEEDLLRILRG